MGFPSDASDSDDDDIIDEQRAGEMLSEMLLSLYFASDLSAKQMCVLSWWAHHAGAKGQVKYFAFSPNAASTGHFQRHIDSVLKLDASKTGKYKVTVPTYQKHDVSRSAHKMMAHPPHEELYKELEANPEQLTELQQSLDRREWPPHYLENPVVRRHRDLPVVPCALYLDAAPFQTHDAFSACFCYSLVAGERHLVKLMRKSTMCKCGCRGWCTLWPVLDFVHWSCDAMAEGEWPRERHDKAPWTDDDVERAEKAGQPLGFVAILLQIKGDWSELCSSLGFPTWGSLRFPCMFCKVIKEKYVDVPRARPSQLPLARNYDGRL